MRIYSTPIYNSHLLDVSWCSIQTDCFSQLQCKRGRREEEEDRGNSAERVCIWRFVATDIDACRPALWVGGFVK